jgi:hypothetical protein
MKKFTFVFVLALNFFAVGAVPAAQSAENLEPVEQSKAYQDFLKKPTNDFSKMVCLLNYFRVQPVMVRFEEIDYTAQFAYPFGLTYLMTHYKNESPEQWARKHCYRSPFNNTIIFLKFQDGSFRPFRDVVLEKYQELEEALKKRTAQAS